MPGRIDDKLILAANTEERVLQRFSKMVDGLKKQFDELTAKADKLQKSIQGKPVNSRAIKDQQELQKVVSSAIKHNDVLREYNKLQTEVNRIKARQNPMNRRLIADLETERQKLKRLKEERLGLTTAIKELNKLKQQEQVLNARLTPQYIKQARAIRDKKNAVKDATNADIAQDQALKNRPQLLDRLTKAVIGYVAAWLSIQSVIGVLKSVFETTKRLDSLNFSIKAIITDSSELAGTQAYLRDISFRYGQELLGLTENYLRFKAALKSTSLSFVETQKIFESVTKVTAVLGLSSKRAELSFLALEQMASKGTVSMEELRRQLGDQIPGAVQIMARALNVSVHRLFEMIKANEVLAVDALPAFARELEKTFGTENINNVDTLQASTNNLKNTWTLFVEDMKASGFFTILQNGLAASLKGMNYNIQFTQKYNNLINQATKDASKFSDELNKTSRQQISDNMRLIDQFRQRRNELDANSREYKEITSLLKDLTNQNKELRLVEIAPTRAEYLESLNTEIIKVEDLVKSMDKKIYRNEWELDYQKQYLETLKDIRDIDATGKETEEETLGFIDEIRKEIESLNKQIVDLEKPKADDPLGMFKYEKEIKRLQDLIQINENIIKRLLGDEVGVRGLINETSERLKNLTSAQNEAWNTAEIEKYGREVIKLQILLKDLQGEFQDFMQPANEEEIELPDFVNSLLYSLDAGKEEVDEFWKDWYKEINEGIRQTQDSLDNQSDFVEKWRNRFGLNEERDYQYRLEALKKFHETGKITEEEYLDARTELWFEKNGKIIQDIGNLYNNLADAGFAYNDYIQQIADREVEIHENKLSELERLKDEEYKLQQKGEANNYDLQVQKYNDEKKLRDQAIEEQKKAQKIEAKIALASQIANLIVTSTELYKSAAKTYKEPITALIVGTSVVAGLLASFYSYKAKMESISSDTPGYAEGTEYLERGKAPKGKDTILIRANEGERIVPTDINKKLEGIPNDKLPDLLNIYKLNYPNIYGGKIQVHDYSELVDRIGAVDRSINSQTDYLRNQEYKYVGETSSQVIIKQGRKTIFIQKQ